MIGALISKDKENSAIDFINIAKYKVENLKKKSKTCFSKAWEYLMETVKKKKKWIKNIKSQLWSLGMEQRSGDPEETSVRLQAERAGRGTTNGHVIHSLAPRQDAAT